MDMHVTSVYCVSHGLEMSIKITFKYNKLSIFLKDYIISHMQTLNVLRVMSTFIPVNKSFLINIKLT